MSGTLATVVRLHHVITTLEETETLLAGVPEWMQELHQEHSRRKEEIDALEAEVLEAGAARRAALVEAEDAEIRLKRYQEQIGSIRTQREYSALLQETDTAKEQIRRAETAAGEAEARELEAQHRLDAAREDFADLDRRYDEAQVKWEAEKPALAAEAEQMRGDIGRIEGELAPQAREVYERTAQRHPSRPLASLRCTPRPRGPAIHSCSACNYRVRPQSVVTVQRLREETSQTGELVLCDGCRRILYLKDAESTGE